MEPVAFFMTKRDPFLVRSEILLMILDLFVIPLLLFFLVVLASFYVYFPGVELVPLFLWGSHLSGLWGDRVYF